MSDTYTKLFRSITASTIVSEPVATRWLWVTMLALADSSGCVWGSVPGLARLANITLPECEAALQCFYSPDPHSRTQDHEGRRIEAIDGGWRLINHAKYGAIRNEAERAEYKRQWDRQNRPSGHARQFDKKSDSPTGVRRSPTTPTTPTAPTPPTPTPTPTLVEAKEKAVHLPMHAVAEKDHHHDDGEPLSTANSQSTFEWAMQHAPNGTPADRWAAWVHHTLETFGGTEAGMRRKLLAEARYLDTCRDPAAVIDTAIARGDDCLMNDWMDEPSGPKQQPAPSSRMAVGLRQLDALARGASLEPADTLQTGLQTVGQLLGRCGLVATDAALTRTDATDAAAYQAAKDGD